MTTPGGAHLHWGAEALWESLAPLLPGVSVEVLARVESTNTRLLERARSLGGDPVAAITRPGDLDALQPAARHSPHGRRAGDVLPCLLVAEQQTRGRGRLGRDWVSEAGASLTFSLSLPLAPQQWGGLSLAVGLAIADALDPVVPGTPPRIGLKWPNDLWLLDDALGHGRKLGGILIETITVGPVRMCVVGVGLNVAPQPGADSPTLAHGFASLQELDASCTAPQALARVARPMVVAVQAFETQGFAPQAAAYARRDLLAGRTVMVSTAQPLQGLAEGVDDQGALMVRDAAGAELRRVISGEVSVRVVAT